LGLALLLEALLRHLLAVLRAALVLVPHVTPLPHAGVAFHDTPTRARSKPPGWARYAAARRARARRSVRRSVPRWYRRSEPGRRCIRPFRVATTTPRRSSTSNATASSTTDGCASDGRSCSPDPATSSRGTSSERVS